MTASIPDDIWRRAASAMDGYPMEAVEICAAALQAERNRATEAERERCALIADDHAKAWGLAHSTPAVVIAAAIRSPSQPTGE